MARNSKLERFQDSSFPLANLSLGHTLSRNADKFDLRLKRVEAVLV
jgi:hypothetical protein